MYGSHSGLDDVRLPQLELANAGHKRFRIARHFSVGQEEAQTLETVQAFHSCFAARCRSFLESDRAAVAGYSVVNTARCAVNDLLCYECPRIDEVGVLLIESATAVMKVLQRFGRSDWQR